MKNLLWFTASLILTLFGTASGQTTLFLKNGKTVVADEVKRGGISLSYQIQVGNGTATTSTSISDIDHVEFADTTTLPKVQDDLVQGKNDEALGELEPFMATQDIFKGIPGNLWYEGATLKAKALIRLKRFEEAEPILHEISDTNPDPDLALESKLLLARQALEKGSPQAALDIFNAIIKQTSNAEILADAWLFKGQAYIALKDHENAVLSLLHIPAFYSNAACMPPALLSASLELDAMGDQKSAVLYLTDLVNKFPSAAETEKAKVELRRIQNVIKSTQSTPNS